MADGNVEARRQRVRAQRARELAQVRRRRTTLVTMALLTASVLVAGVVLLVTHVRGSSIAAGRTPPGVTSTDGGYVLPGNPADDAPTLDVWEDFQCPACKNFETVQGSTVTDLAASGRVRVVVHVVTLIGDHGLGNRWSGQAAQAAAAAAAQGEFLAFHRLTFAQQPAEGDGFTDRQLRGLAEQAGVGDLEAWQRAYDDGTYAAFVERVEKRAETADGLRGTPTLRVGTREISYADAVSATPEQFTQLVLQGS